MGEKRFRKDYSLDGWPIADTHNQVVLSDDEIVNLLNEYDQKDTESPSDPGGSISAFKEWYDDIWKGDDEMQRPIPRFFDDEYREYLDGYTLALGAWQAAIEWRGK